MKKRLFASVLLCSLTLSAIATPSIALADNVDKKIEKKKSRNFIIKSKTRDLASQVSSLEAEVSSVFDESMALREQKQTLKAKSEQLQQEITNLNQRIEKRNEAIKNQARDVQVNGQKHNNARCSFRCGLSCRCNQPCSSCFNNRKCQQRLNATTKEDKQAVVDKKLKTRKSETT